MIDIAILRDEPGRVRQAMLDKGYKETALIDKILALDVDRREILTRLQHIQTLANGIAKEVGELFREGRKEEAEQKKASSVALKGQQKELEDASRDMNDRLHHLLLEVPNIPHPSVPTGATPADNHVTWQSPHLPSFIFPAQPHWVLAEQHGLLDFERGAKVTGAGFPFMLGQGARLQRALINFFLDEAHERGYKEILPPLFVNAESATGTGQLPDKEDQMYEMPRDGFYAIPTAEVPVTNFHRNEILDQKQLPVKLCAFTPCFRREAGSYGKEVRGLNRLHAFDKVELVQFVAPELSYDALESLREDAEHLLNKLELPYRRLLMCTGDMGFTQAKKYDLEVWSAGQERWLEVSSISNFESFQARRMNIRYRQEDQKKPAFVHTLNGSALALPRIVATLLENGQQADGSITIPAVLQKYTGFSTIS